MNIKNEHIKFLTSVLKQGNINNELDYLYKITADDEPIFNEFIGQLLKLVPNKKEALYYDWWA